MLCGCWGTSPVCSCRDISDGPGVLRSWFSPPRLTQSCPSWRQRPQPTPTEACEGSCHESSLSRAGKEACAPGWTHSPPHGPGLALDSGPSWLGLLGEGWPGEGAQSCSRPRLTPGSTPHSPPTLRCVPWGFLTWWSWLGWHPPPPGPWTLATGGGPQGLRGREPGGPVSCPGPAQPWVL